MTVTPESRDAICVELSDLEVTPDTTVRPVHEDILRRLLREQVLSERAVTRWPEDLDRMLALAQQEQHACRQQGDLAGLARCLGNEGLIRKARGELEQALVLHDEELAISRRQNDPRGVVAATAHKANVLVELNRLSEALALAEEANRLTAGLADPSLSALVTASLALVRQRLNGTPSPGA